MLRRSDRLDQTGMNWEQAGMNRVSPRCSAAVLGCGFRHRLGAGNERAGAFDHTSERAGRCPNPQPRTAALR